MFLTKKLILAVVGCCLTTVGVSPANHVDFIVDGGFFLSTDAPSSPASGMQTGAGGNIIGAERDVMISTDSGFVSVGTVNAPSGPGPVGPDPNVWMQFSNSVSSSGQLMLTYDGAGTAGLGGLDFDTNWNFLAVDFSGVQGSGDVSVEVRDTNSNTGSMTQAVSAAAIYHFGFSDSGYAGVDFGSVDSIKITIDTITPASDFGINAVTREVVPEPGSSHLLMMAVLGLLIGTARSPLMKTTSGRNEPPYFMWKG